MAQPNHSMDPTWDIIDRYFSQGGGTENANPLVQHQIESFNEFIDKKLCQIIQGFNSIQICHNYKESVKDFAYKIFINIQNPSLSKPIFQQQDGSQILMTPHIARMNSLTYGVNIYADIHILTETINQDNVVEKNEVKVPAVNVGKIPIMVRSKVCILNQVPGIAENSQREECRYDPGGYFIVNGNEKVIISQDRISENKTLVFSANGCVTDGLNAEIRSAPDGMFLPPKTTSLSLSAKPNHMGRTIRLNTSFLRSEIPLFVMFRALGVQTDREILQHILFDIDDEKNRRLLNEMAATVDDASDIYTQEQALKFLMRYVGITGTPKEYLEQPEQARKILLQVIRNDFLPHVGPSFQRKALYLGYMVRKLMKIYLGYQLPDNRDSYLHKRIDTPGVLISNLFRQCWGKMLKEMRNSIQRELQLWRATPVIPTNIFNASNIHRFIKQSIIDMGIRYALSTGNWGVKTLGSFQNIRTGVAQVLNRMSYLSTLSHLRRINTPMEKNGKLVQPRKLENSQFGVICPAETPEGSSVGLVKNIALSTRITSSMSSIYVRKCIGEMGVHIYDDTVKETESFLKEMGEDLSVHIMVNGDLIGYHRDPKMFYDQMKNLKRRGEIPPTTGICWDVPQNLITISTEAGRMCRPLYIVDTEEERKEIRIHKWMREHPEKTKELLSKSFSEFITRLDENKEGFIEYLDVDEIDKSMIAMFPKDLNKQGKMTYVPPKYTHCEIHPSLMLGVLACNIPFSDHNQSPRNCYQCLWEEEPVLMEDGSKKKIKDVKVGDKVITFNPDTMETEVTTVIHQYVKPTDKTIVEITTYSGRKIVTTDDHKYMTNQGWKMPKEFDSKTKVGILQTPLYLEHNVSNPECIMTMDDFVNILRKYNVKDSLIQKHSQICMKNGLLPLYTNDSRLPIIARMCGYVLTDGSLNIYDKKHGGQTSQLQACFGTMKDALEFEKDVASLGFESIVPKEGTRTHPSGAIHHTFDICRNGPLSSLFIALGISFGKKTETLRNEVPSWIMNGSKQVQREFCAGIQGGDGCMIRFNKRKSGYNYICAKTSQQIHPDYKDSLIVFMDQIVKMMKNLDIEVSDVTSKQVKTNRVEVSYKIRDTHENLIKYYDVIGYRYSNHKNMNSAVVVEFLKWKESIVEKRTMQVKKIYEMFNENIDKQNIMEIFNITYNQYADLYRCYKAGRAIRSPYLKDVNMCKWLEMIEVKENTIFMPVTIELKENCMIADITVNSEYHCFFGGDNFAVHNSAMGKQAVGTYMSNYNQRIDTMAHVLNYPQKPLARTRLSKYTNSDNLPSGMNAVVAIMTKSGFNQEDSVMVNKSALDRGLFASTYYKAYRDQCSKNHSTGEEEQFTKPLPTTSHIKPYNYDKLDDKGFIPKNTYVDDNDIIVGKVMPHKIQGQIFPRDASMVMKTNDSGHVDMTYQGVNSEGYKFIKLRLRKYRKPTIGDKLSSRHGQKGTIGMIYSQEDMPFSKDGITPDIIMNPHAIPSRMTVGQLIECIMGKSASLLGTLGDATPFTECSVEKVATILESFGMERYGNEILYNGRTGEMIHTEIFMGPTFYQRLKHMVSDKIHCLTMDHEVLTEKGWKLFHELEEEDKVATLQDGHLVYEKPIEKHYYPNYQGKMYHISNSAIDLDVTEEHRMWVSSCHTRKRIWSPYYLKKANELVGKSVRYQKNAIWDVPAYQFELPAYNGKKYTYKAMQVPMDDWLTFFGIWMAEGWTTTYKNKSGYDVYKVQICHCKQRVRDALYTALNNMGYSYNLHADKTTIQNRQLYMYMKDYSVGAPNKYLPDWVWKLDMEQCRKLIYAMQLGDGSFKKDSNVSIYYTSSQRLANDFMKLCIHAGWTGNISLHHKAGSKTILKDGRVIMSQNDIWRIAVVKVKTNPEVNHTHSKKQSVQREMMYDYEGPVFCLSVSSEVFMVRRNGKAVWTGNSRGSNGPVVKYCHSEYRKMLASLRYGRQHDQIAGITCLKSIVPRAA